MFCEKCGSQITEGATFCNVCGNQINHEHSTYKKNRKSKPKIIAIIAICVVIVATAIAVPVSISSCKKDTSLEGMLTAHKWVEKLSKHGSYFTIEFDKDGTFNCTWIEEKNELFKGNWKIDYKKYNNTQYAVLLLSNMMKNTNNEGWEKYGDSSEEFSFLNDKIDDTYIENFFKDYNNMDIEEFDNNIENTLATHTWYVSDKYMAHGRIFNAHWRICVPQ